MKKISNKKITALILLLLVLNMIFYCAILAISAIYPDKNGFNRNILYIKPSQNTGQYGYYIIEDDIVTSRSSYSDIYFHGLGVRTINNQTVEWVNGDAALNLTILHPEVQIIPIQGYVFQSTEQNATTFGVKITPKIPGSIKIISLFQPLNKSKGDKYLIATPISNIFSDDNVVRSWTINQTDKLTLYSNNTINFINDNMNFLDYQKNPINSKKILTSDDNLAIRNKTITKATSPPDTSQLEHPFLYFNPTQKLEIENRINGTNPGPWKNWYDWININYSTLTDRAFKAYMEEDLYAINSIISSLLNISSLEPFRQNLNRGSWVCDYIFAYDILYNYMTIEERQFFESEAFRITYPSADSIIHNVCPNNNHKIVSLSAYGLLGLILNNASMIELMQDQMNHAFNNFIKRGGACFEGPSYLEYTMKYATRFMFALKNVGGYDYFNDPNYIDVLNYTLNTRTPDGTHALFEDSHANVTIASIVLNSISQIEDNNLELSQNLRWYVQQYGLDSISDGHYTSKLFMYSTSGTIKEPESPFNGSYIYFEGGQAGMGTGQKNNDTMLVISNKNYIQMHAHYDENSIEFWVLGKKILTNAGYPNFGGSGHSYTISTQANNAIIIGGHPQYSINSDGFKSMIVSDDLIAIESPCFIAYDHSLSLSRFPWLEIFLVIELLSLVLISIILFSKNNNRNSKDSENFKQLMAENNTKTINILQLIQKNKYNWINVSILIFQNLGFLLVIYLSIPYISKGIEHFEALPDIKSIFMSALVYITLILSIFSIIFISIRMIVQKKKFFKKILVRYCEDEKLIEDKSNLDYYYNSFMGINVIYYIIWAIISVLLIYPGFLQIFINLLTEGSTIWRFIELFLSDFIIVLIYAFFIMIGIRYIIYFFGLRNKTYIKTFFKKYLRRDIIRLILFSFIIGFGIYFIQEIGIELLQF